MAGIEQEEQPFDWEAKVAALKCQLSREKENTDYEKRLRANYYTKHCAARKEWLSRNLNLRKEIHRLQEEKKSAEKDMNLYEHMLGEKDRQIEQLQKVIKENELKMSEMEKEHRELLDHFLSVKVNLEKMISRTQV